jgi:hypothetical protein
VAKRAICPRRPVKGAPKICKRGAPKGVILKKYLERFLYKSWYAKNLLDHNFTVIGPKKSVLDVIL